MAACRSRASRVWATVSASRAVIFALVFARGVAQESATLPPPCPILGPLGPGDAPPPFSFAAVTPGGSISNVSFPGAPLPLVLFVVDVARDPGGVLLASDAAEVDRFLARAPPRAGSFAFLSTDSPGYADGALRAVWEARLALLAPAQAAAWRPLLSFATPTVAQLAAAGSELATLLAAWPSPRLFVDAPAPDAISAPRVDAFYECFQWPPASRAFAAAGPFEACDPRGTGAVADGSILVVVNATEVGGSCDASAATAWALKAAPNAAGAVVSAPAPEIVGRDCDDTFVDAQFYPLVVSAPDGAALAARAAAGPLTLSLNFTCETATWLAIDARGRLAPVGWRKYTEATALRWAVDELLRVEELRANASLAAATIPIMPPHSVVNNFARNVTFPSARALRSAAGRSAVLDFSLQCAGEGDNDCGPWDRIFSATATCWPSASGPAASPTPVEIARWISPFRRSTGRWQTSANALVGLVGNGSAAPAQDAWTCEIATSSCCEPWQGALDLLLFDDGRDAAGAGGSAAATAPIATIPIVFPNMATHFGPLYNDNRTTLIVAPSEPFSSVTLFALISGHGSDPPPPASQGCEYAPTSHAFAVGPAGQAPALTVNSSQVAYNQYMLAGSIFGCADKVGGSFGVIGNQHGDWRDGRNGWCPGEAVWPLEFDVSAAFVGGSGASFEVAYSALSYYVDGSHPSPDGCGGDIVFGAAFVFFN